MNPCFHKANTANFMTILWPALSQKAAQHARAQVGMDGVLSSWCDNPLRNQQNSKQGTIGNELPPAATETMGWLKATFAFSIFS